MAKWESKPAENMVTMVRKGSPAADVFVRMIEGAPIRPGQVEFVSDEEMESLRKDVEHMRVA